jgi:hypothetical protein
MRSVYTILLVLFCVSAAAAPCIAVNDNRGRPGGDTLARDHQIQQETGNPMAGEDASVAVRGAADGEEKVASAVNRSASPMQDQDKIQGNHGKNRVISSGEIPTKPEKETTRSPERNSTGGHGNGNEISKAVHALLAMENRTGGIGPQISAIAQEFNNSLPASWRSEETIRNRGAIVSFLFGSDKAAVAEIANLTAANQARVVQINQVLASLSLDSETRAMLEAQIQIMERETTRLNETAIQAKKNRGIFDWFNM